LVSKEGEEIGGQEFQYHPGLRRDLRVRRLGYAGKDPNPLADKSELSIGEGEEKQGIAMTPRQMEEKKAEDVQVNKEKAKSDTSNNAKEEETKALSRKLDGDDWDKSQEEKDDDEDDDGVKTKPKQVGPKKRQKKKRPFKSAKTNPRVFFKRAGSFLQKESVLDVGFALGDFKASTSDFVGSLYGSNYYKWFTFPMSKVYNFYMMEDNP